MTGKKTPPPNFIAFANSLVTKDLRATWPLWSSNIRNEGEGKVSKHSSCPGFVKEPKTKEKLNKSYLYQMAWHSLLVKSPICEATKYLFTHMDIIGA